MQEHAHPDFSSFSTILIIFTIAGIFVPLFRKLKIPAIPAYLICGILAGPHGFARLNEIAPFGSAYTISDTNTVMLLGEIGIMFLMFMIGLELSLEKLLSLKRYVLGLGTLQIIITAILIALIVTAFGNSIQTSIIIGLSFALSSTAIVMQLLHEHHKTNRQVGAVAFSVLLMQDLAVVPLLVILAGLSENSGGNLLVTLAQSLIIAAVTVLSIYAIGSRFLKPLLSYLSLSKNPEWLISLVFLLAVGSAVLTQNLGLSAALGAFLAGLLIAETDFRHEVEVIIEPVKSLLLGIFFLSVGMQIDIATLSQYPLLIAVSVIGLFIIKTFSLYPLARYFALPRGTAFDISVRLAQAGEFALLMIGPAISGGIITKTDGQFFLVVATLSMFAAPFFTKLSPIFIRKFFSDGADIREALSLDDSHGKTNDSPRILIAGYGRVGRLLGGVLEQQNIPFVAIENNFENVRLLKNQGHRVIFADARKIDIWKKLHRDTVKAVVIAIDSPDAAEHILRSLRAEWPTVPIIIRTRDTGQMEKLYNLGATHAIPEALESSMIIAAKTLKTIGLNPETVDREIDRNRRSSILNHSDT